MLEKFQARRGVPQIFDKSLHLADTLAGQVLAALQDEEVWDLLPQALRVPDRRRYIWYVVFRADHGQHAGDAYGAQVVEADRVLEEDGLRRGVSRSSRRVAFDRLYNSLAGLRGKIPVLEDTAGHQGRALGVVGWFPQGVGLVEPDVVQQGGRAQDLHVVGDALGCCEFLGQREDPQAVGVPVHGVRPDPGNQHLYLFDHRFHGKESSESARSALRAPLVSTFRPTGSTRQHAPAYGFRLSARIGL